MAPAFTVEPATTDDLDSLVDLWVDLVGSQRAFGAHIESEANRTTARDILAQYVAGDRVATAKPVPDTDGPDVSRPILGFVMYYLEDGVYEMDTSRGIVENVYVVPDARDQGIGTQLMDYAEATLADRGASVIALSVMAANERGRSFYDDRGYEAHRVIFERTLESGTDE